MDKEDLLGDKEFQKLTDVETPSEFIEEDEDEDEAGIYPGIFSTSLFTHVHMCNVYLYFLLPYLNFTCFKGWAHVQFIFSDFSVLTLP